MQNETISKNVSRGPDGVYRWVFSFPLLKNPTVFFLVWKILFGILAVVAAISTAADAIQIGLSPERILASLRFWGLFVGGMTVLVAVGYLIYAAMMGWTYCVLFEMDEKGVNHKQVPVQARKAKKLAKAAALGGLASGSLSAAGVGMNAAGTEMYSEFSRVRKVKAYRRRNLIKVNGRFSRNQVYAAPEDFDFVLSFITARCPDAGAPEKTRGGE